MGLIVVVVGCAALTGRLCGGRLTRLGEGPVRGWRLLATGLGVVVLTVTVDSVGGLGLPAGTVDGAALIVCGALVGLFSLANRRVHGVALVGLGLLLNVVAIGLNGAMPVSRHALLRAGASGSGFDVVGHTPADHRTVLRFLGDVIPVPLPGHREVDSIGDLLVAAGAAQFVLTGMLRRTRLPGARPWPSRGPGRRRPAPLATGFRFRRRATVRDSYHPHRQRGRVIHADSALVRVVTERPGGDRPDGG